MDRGRKGMRKPVAWRTKNKNGEWLYYDEEIVGTEPLYSQEQIDHMIEKQSHYEAMTHAGGFEAGRQQGMKQERALWELAASTQEIEK
jgi:hypothetical protein